MTCLQYFGHYFAIGWLYVHVMGVYVGRLLQNVIIHVFFCAQDIFYDHFIVKKGQK